LFIEDSCDIKFGLVAEVDIIRTFRALKPFRQLLLRTSLTEIAEDGQFLFITMFIFKDRGPLLTSGTDTIP
jgi:hypothetical protein